METSSYLGLSTLQARSTPSQEQDQSWEQVPQPQSLKVRPGVASLTSYKPCCFPGLRRELTLHVGLAISSKGSHLGQTVSLTVELVGLGLGEDLVIFSPCQLSSTLAMSTDQAL